MTRYDIYDTDTSDMLLPHNMLRAALGDANRAIQGANPSDRERVLSVAGFYDNVLRFLSAHHGAEDALLWPKLHARAPEHASLLDRMEGQHANIAKADQAAASALDAWSKAPQASTGDALVEALGQLLTVLDEHLREEEREILPIASRTISPEEWGEISGHAVRTFDGDKPWLVLGLVLEQMTVEQREITFGHLPPPALAMWTEHGSDAFTAFVADFRS